MYNGQYHVVGEKTRTIQYVITVNGSVSDVLKNQPIQSLEFVKKEGQDVVIEQDSKNYYLKVTLVPAYATVESMKWSSSDESVASVDDGIVSFHKAGVVELKVVVNGRYEAKLPLTITPMCIGENAVYLIFDRTDMDLVLWDGIDRYRSTRYKKDEDYTLDIEEIEDELKVTVKGINLLCDEIIYYINKSDDISNICYVHSWDEGTQLKEQDCGNDGEYRFSCTQCGAVATKTFWATQLHDWDEGVIVSEPTCVKKGDKKQTCLVCGQEKHSEIPPTGVHSYGEKSLSTTATFSRAGVEKEICTVCGDVNEYRIAPINEVKLETYEYTYDGDEKMPEVTAYDKDGNVISKKYYDVEYNNNIVAGCANAKIIFKERYGETKTLNYLINPRIVDNPKISFKDANSFVYTGSEIKPDIVVKENDKIIPTTEYTIKYENNTQVGKGYIRIIGNGNYNMDAEAVFDIVEKKVISPVIILSQSSYVYDGNEKTPSVKVMDGDTVINSDEYNVLYENNYEIGTATVRITDLRGGNYIVNGTASFTITAGFDYSDYPGGISGAVIEMEPNNSKPTANSLKIGESCVGELGSKIMYESKNEIKDQDWYSFELKSGGHYRIILDDFVKTFLNTSMHARLYTPSGSWISLTNRMRVLRNNDYVFEAAESGVYSVVLFNYVDKNSNEGHLYKITLKDVSDVGNMRKILNANGEQLIVGDSAVVSINGIDISKVTIKGKGVIYSKDTGIVKVTKKGKAKILYPIEKNGKVKNKSIGYIKVEQPKIKAKVKLITGVSKRIKLSGTKITPDYWESSNENVVKIAQDGVVEAVAEGEAVISAYVGLHKYECKVTVTEKL